MSNTLPQTDYSKEVKYKKHGLANHPLYNIWRSMINRCHLVTDAQYHHYGGRGIFVCDEWRNDFMVYYNWCIANGWQQRLTIDRENNNEGYSPENCRIVTQKTNCRNKRITVKVSYKGENKSLLDWIDILKINPLHYGMIKSRLDYGWSFEDAITKPKGTVLAARPQGEKSFRSKLTNEQAIEIFLSKEGIRPLGRKYGLNHKAISNIQRGKSYSCVTKNIIK